MAMLDRPNACDFEEYTAAFAQRLKEGYLTDNEILMLYLRLERRQEAIKLPVQVSLSGNKLGGLAVDVTIVNDDLKRMQGAKPCPGILIDGIWGYTDDTNTFIATDISGRKHTTCDGAFRQYDDGLDMSLIRKELAFAGADRNLDLGSFRF